MEGGTEKKCLERRLGLTGDLEADIENLSPGQGLTLSENIKRTHRINSISFLVRDILMPLLNNISDILMIIFLWRREDKTFAYMTLALFYLPTIFLIVHFILHFKKRNHFILKLLLFPLVGPAVDWIINIYLLLRRKKTDLDEESQKFLDIIKVVNGVIESSLQLTWTLVLICLEVSPLPWVDMTMMRDILGNTFPLPVSSLSLLFSVFSILSQLTFYWRTFGLRRRKRKVEEEEGETSCLFLVYPIVLTHLVFRVGVLALVSLFANIYSVSLLGVSLVTYSLLRLTRTCHEADSVLGEAVASLANSIVMIPTSREHRAHNLYFIHDTITNVFMMAFIIGIQIINFDYNNPLFIRPDALIISHDDFVIFIFILVSVICLNYLTRVIFFCSNQRTPKKTLFKMKVKATKVNVAKALLSLVNLGLVVATVILAVMSFYLSPAQPPPASAGGGGNCGLWLQSAENKSNIAPISCGQAAGIEKYLQHFSLETFLNDSDCFGRTWTPSSRTFYDLDLSQEEKKVGELEKEWSLRNELSSPAVMIFLCFMLSLSLSWLLILIRSHLRKILTC